MKVTPLADRIVVQRDTQDEMTAGGIVLPEKAKEKPQQGKILAVGPGKMMKDGTRRGMTVKEGDTVLFTTWAGDEYKANGKDDVLIMREEDVLAIVE